MHFVNGSGRSKHAARTDAGSRELSFRWQFSEARWTLLPCRLSDGGGKKPLDASCRWILRKGVPERDYNSKDRSYVTLAASDEDPLDRTTTAG